MNCYFTYQKYQNSLKHALLRRKKLHWPHLVWPTLYLWCVKSQNSFNLQQSGYLLQATLAGGYLSQATLADGYLLQATLAVGYLFQATLADGWIMLSTCPFVRRSIHCQTGERDILKTNEKILMPKTWNY